MRALKSEFTLFGPSFLRMLAAMLLLALVLTTGMRLLPGDSLFATYGRTYPLMLFVFLFAFALNFRTWFHLALCVGGSRKNSFWAGQILFLPLCLVGAVSAPGLMSAAARTMGRPAFAASPLLVLLLFLGGELAVQLSLLIGTAHMNSVLFALILCFGASALIAFAFLFLAAFQQLDVFTNLLYSPLVLAALALLILLVGAFAGIRMQKEAVRA